MRFTDNLRAVEQQKNGLRCELSDCTRDRRPIWAQRRDVLRDSQSLALGQAIANLNSASVELVGHFEKKAVSFRQLGFCLFKTCLVSSHMPQSLPRPPPNHQRTIRTLHLAPGAEDGLRPSSHKKTLLVAVRTERKGYVPTLAIPESKRGKQMLND